MLPELFRIPILGFPVYGFGLMLIVGLFLGSQLVKWLGPRVGINPEVLLNAGLIALITGVIGSRLSHVLENLGQYTNANRSAWENFTDAINIADGGLTFYGGFIFGTTIVMWYGLKKRVPILPGMDVMGPALMVGLALGRVGCFMNGCCYGQPVAWGVEFPYGSPAYVDQYYAGDLPQPDAPLVNEAHQFAGRPVLVDRRIVSNDPDLKALAHDDHAHPVHATQLYSTVTSLLVTGVLVAFFTLRPAPGRVFALMLMLEGLTRFLLESIRAEPAVVGAGTDTLTWLPSLSLSMLIGLVLIPLGAAMWYVVGKFAPPRIDDPDAPPAGVPTSVGTA